MSNRSKFTFLLSIALLLLVAPAEAAELFKDGRELKQAPSYPAVEKGEPREGVWVSVTDDSYKGTDVHHLVYLPHGWSKSRKYPILVELTGNKWPWGSGEVEEAHLSYSLSRGEDFILVVLPYVAKGGKKNEVTWWGDDSLTIDYAKRVVPKVAESYSGDKNRVVLCGFSRGAIGVSYIGLHDDEIASLWCGFFTHDHFDGQREWKKTYWGSPLAKYREEAAIRLSRAEGKEWYLSFNGADDYSKPLEEMGVKDKIEFIFAPAAIGKRFVIPNPYFKHSHNDCWPLFDIPESKKARKWLYKLVGLDLY